MREHMDDNMRRFREMIHINEERKQNLEAVP